MEVEKQATPQQQQKKLPRALKNLQIDMTCKSLCMCIDRRFFVHVCTVH